MLQLLNCFLQLPKIYIYRERALYCVPYHLCFFVIIAVCSIFGFDCSVLLCFWQPYCILQVSIRASSAILDYFLERLRASVNVRYRRDDIVHRPRICVMKTAATTIRIQEWYSMCICLSIKVVLEYTVPSFQWTSLFLIWSFVSIYVCMCYM